MVSNENSYDGHDWAGLAGTYVYLAFAGALTRHQAYRSAKESLAKALKLDDSIGEAHDTLGVLSWKLTGIGTLPIANSTVPSPWRRATVARMRTAPFFLAMLGRRAEALAEIAKIDQLDYSFSAAMTESKTYYQLRDYPRLIEADKRWLLLNQNGWFQHYALGIGYEGTGKLQEAISEYQQAIAMSGGSESTVALAHAFRAIGKKAEAEKILRDLEHKAKESSTSPYTMATIYAGLD